MKLIAVVCLSLAVTCLSFRQKKPNLSSSVDDKTLMEDIESLVGVKGACNDFVHWTDVEGDSCSWYSQNGWCNGAPVNPLSEFREFGKDGISADLACCDCAGGNYNHDAGEAGGLEHKGAECWEGCGGRQGWCSFCGNGLCCRANYGDDSNGCDGWSHGINNAIMTNSHVCVAHSKRCLVLANHKHSDLVKAAKLVDAVYAKPTFETMTTHYGLKTVFYVADGAHDLDFGFSPDPLEAPSQNDKHPWVVFGGSESTEDWKTNFNALWSDVTYPLKVPGAKIHNGFQSQWAAAKADVVKRFQSLKDHGITKVFLAGHSLGGAVATVAAAEIQTLFPDMRVELITYGAPMCGNAAFGENINHLMSSRITRVVNSGDPVPCLTQVVGYADNIAGEVCFNEGSGQWSTPREEHCNKDVADMSMSIKDHSMLESYIPLMEHKCTY